MTVPDFLCIGAQKAGTTWLDTNIRCHPNVWMPPVKELHYFDRHPSPYIKDLVHHDPVIRSRFRRRVSFLLRDLAATTLRPWHFVNKLRWYLRFILMSRSERWYVSLFTPAKGQITGDVTPDYARLSEKDVARVYALMPEAKIIYLLRNPIERMWSEAAMYYSRNGYAGINTIASDTVREFLMRASTAANSTYTKVLHRWRQFYSDKRIFIGFFEQLCQCPQTLLSDIYEFLELADAHRHVPDTVRRRVHAGSYPPLPNHFAHEMAQRFCDEIRLLHQTFSNKYTEHWLDWANRRLTQ
jgi:hypothetical protein